jgi:hypothetical protein
LGIFEIPNWVYFTLAMIGVSFGRTVVGSKPLM